MPLSAFLQAGQKMADKNPQQNQGMEEPELDREQLCGPYLACEVYCAGTEYTSWQIRVSKDTQRMRDNV